MSLSVIDVRFVNNFLESIFRIFCPHLKKVVVSFQSRKIIRIHSVDTLGIKPKNQTMSKYRFM